jgi:hypothetical protein
LPPETPLPAPPLQWLFDATADPGAPLRAIILRDSHRSIAWLTLCIAALSFASTEAEL